MAKTVAVIGVDPEELPWLHSVIWLLRHPDPKVPELTRQALLYLEASSASLEAPGAGKEPDARRDAM
jgi:hypothetical protein